MTYSDENLPNNTTVVFVPANSPQPRKSGKGRLAILSFLTALLAAALFWWVQDPSMSAGIAAQASPNVVLAAAEDEGVLAIVGPDGASLYDEPNGFEVANFTAGEELTAVGRTGDDNWLAVQANNGQEGWTPRDSLVLVGLNRLPVTGENAEVNIADATGDTDTETGDNTASDDSTGDNTASGESTQSDNGNSNNADDAGAELPPTSTPVSASANSSDSTANNDSTVGSNEAMADDDSGSDGAMADRDSDSESAGEMAGNDSGSDGAMADDDSGSDGAMADDDSGSDGAMADDDSESDGAMADDDSGLDGAMADDDSGLDGAMAGSDSGTDSTSAAVPALSVASASTVLGVIRSSDAQLRVSPNGELLESSGENAGLKIGDSVTIVGRTDSTDWLQVRTDEAQEGWVSKADLVAFRLENLPVVDPTAPVAQASAATDGAATSPASGTTAEGTASGSTGSTGSSSSGGTTAPAGNAAASPSASAPATGSSQPSAASQPSAGMSGVVSSAITQLNVRSGPGVNYAPVGKVNANDSLSIVGRSRSGGWLLSNNPLPSVSQGWISAQFVNVSGAVSSLPIEVSSASPVTTNPVAATSGASSTASPNPSPAIDVASSSATSAAPAGGLTGKLVFQSKLGGSIYLYEMGTGSLRELTTGFDPSLSPDGQKVAFTRLGGNGGLYIINVDGSNERRVFASDQAPRSPSWSPAGDKIVFSRLSGEYRCTNLGFGLCIKSNKFLSDFPKVEKEERGLSRVDLDGENFRDIPALNTAKTPDWTANGIVYAATTSLELTQDSPDDENKVIINQVIGHQDPARQPNGDRVIFQVREGSHWEIYGVDINGGGIASLTKPITTLVDQIPSNVAPAWSPDGQSVVYLSNRDASNDAGAWRIWVMTADGGNQRPLPINVPIEYQYNLEQMVDWGP